MTAGLPGTGIGGLFYLCAALGMPVMETARALAGRTAAARWLRVAKSATLALGMAAALFVTGLILDLPVSRELLGVPASRGSLPGIFYVAPVIVAGVTLAGVILGVEILSLLFAEPIPAHSGRSGHPVVSVARTVRREVVRRPAARLRALHRRRRLAPGASERPPT